VGRGRTVFFILRIKACTSTTYSYNLRKKSVLIDGSYRFVNNKVPRRRGWCG
jgi:hypothetical protein